MEILFRRHFWIFHVVFLGLVAFFLARTINTSAGAVLKAKLDSPTATASTSRAKPTRRTRNFEAATDANIFKAKREQVTENPDGAAVCKSDTDCERGVCQDGVCVEGDPSNDLSSALPSSLRARLVGTAVFSEPEFSLASIVDLGGGRNAEADLYSINPCEPEPVVQGDAGPDPIGAARQPCNELMDTAEIKLIDANRVYFFNKTESRYEYLELGVEPEGKGRAVAAKRDDNKEKKPSRKRKGSKLADELGEGISKIDDTRYEIKQESVDKALGNLAGLATQARIVPAFEGGEPVGFKLFSIRPGSLYSKIGIQNGDVISRINGYEINSPDKALEVYQKLKDSKDITVDLKRRGKPMTMTYGIAQ
jgi:general secretion pathway protein C